VTLHDGDVLVVGVCTHIYQIVVPFNGLKRNKSIILEGDEGNEDDDDNNAATNATTPVNSNDDDTTVSYNEAVRQVMLGRPENAEQKKVRLAHLVISTWRRPVYRRLFEERLVDALRMSAEANEIVYQMKAGVKFSVHLGCAVNLEDASSLSLREVIKYEHVHVLVRASVVDVTEKSIFDESDSDDDGAETEHTMCECGRVPFAEFLEDLRNDYQSMKPLCGVSDDGPAGGERPSEESTHPSVFLDLLSAKGVDMENLQVTMLELFTHLKNVQNHSLDIDKDLLVDNISDVLQQDDVDDNTVLTGDDILDVVQRILEKTFDDCMHPLVEQFGVGKYAGGGGGGAGGLEGEDNKNGGQTGGVRLDMEAVGRLIEALQNGDREALLADIVGEMNLLSSDAKFSDLGLKPVVLAMAAATTTATPAKGGELIKNSEEEESPMPKSKLRFEAPSTVAADFDKVVDTSLEEKASPAQEASDDRKGSLDLDILGEHGEDWEGGPVTPGASPTKDNALFFAGADEAGAAGDEVDDWELHHDEASGADYWYSESRGESKWIEAEEEEPEHAAVEEVEETKKTNSVSPRSGRKMSTPTRLVDEPITDPAELDKYARLYSIDDHEFEENPDPDFRDHTYSDSDEEEDAEDEEAAAIEKEESWKGDEDEVESIDDWKIVHDEESGRDFWWSDTREEANWVDELEEGHDPHHDHLEKYHHTEVGEDGRETHYEIHEDENGNEFLYDPITQETKWKGDEA
jgi:hypothetical protein